MFAVSDNRTSAWYIGSQVMRDRASEGSNWSVKGALDPRSVVRPDLNCVHSEPEQM